MDEPKFTQGPWFIPLGGSSSGHDNFGWVHVMRPTGMYRKTDDGGFEEVPPYTGQHVCSYIANTEEDRANGRLIAASPSLFAALQETLAIARRNEDGDYIQRAEAALAQAMKEIEPPAQPVEEK
jgi:hypothetical protein